MSYVPVAGQLLDVTFWEPLRFDLAQSLCEGEKRLVVLGLGHVGASQLGVEGGVAQHGQHVQQEARRIGLTLSIGKDDRTAKYEKTRYKSEKIRYLMQRCLAEG